tara:strand:- start:802 stop:1407 length:606 start_codon:yes stop_codon:yes gene_type:complete
MTTQRPWPQRRRLQDGQLAELSIVNYESGESTVIYETAELIEAPNWTPDGDWLIFNADGRIFRISPDGKRGPERINTEPIEDLNNDHVFSPDGKQIYLSSRNGHLYRVPIAGGGQPKRVSNQQEAERNFRYYLHGVSPDGKTLGYVGVENREGGGTKMRICTIPTQGGTDQFLTDGSAPVEGPEFSVDGKWIYFNGEAPSR